MSKMDSQQTIETPVNTSGKNQKRANAAFYWSA